MLRRVALTELLVLIMIKITVAKSKNIAYREQISFYHGKECKRHKNTVRNIDTFKCIYCVKPRFN